MMDNQTARGIIRRIALKHPEFVLAGRVQITGDSFFMQFNRIDKSLNTVDNWIRAAGGVPIALGVDGTGDRETMYARVK